MTSVTGWVRVLLPAALLIAAACGSSKNNGGGAGGSGGSGATGGGGGTGNTAPVQPDATDYTYKLKESTNALTLWTTPATHKVLPNERAPSATKSGLKLAAARGEFEPAQLVVDPAGGSVKVSVAKFSDLPAGQRVKLATVGYDQGWPEHLTPLASGGSVTLSGTQAQPIWLTVYVPYGTTKGDHTTTLTLTPGSGAAISVPVMLHVFDFDMPKDIHFATQLNVSVQSLIPNGGSTEDAKTLLFEHRMTPKSATWPSGLGYNITWDSSANPNRCSAFYDEPNDGAQYSIKALAKKYILGQGWNGVGYPNAMLFQFVDNSTPRPTTFCGQNLGSDPAGTAAYNAAWSKYLAALDQYIVQNGYDKKAYYYVQNEPQNAADYKTAAALCRLTKAAAPHLRIAISEEPKPGIAEDPGGACGYDIWIAHVRAYQEKYAWQRQRDHGEQVWFYSLDQDPDPYFNPTRVDTQGMHERIIPWVAWGRRIRGWAYYDAGRFFDGARPTIRAELLREGFEDYEYLWLANGKAYPVVDQAGPADATAKSVASGLTSWTKDADALMALRYELGRYIEGSRSTLPVLEANSNVRKRGAYYLNFQDPKGQPAASPLVVGGHTYMKIGWDPWNDKKGYGWSGQYIKDPSIALFGFDNVSGFPLTQKSYVYDDYGRDNLFEFAIENGKYTVTVAVGRPAKGYPNDPHNLSVEGTKLVDDEVTTDAQPVIVKSTTVDLMDGAISFVVGGKSAKTGDYAYTFLDSIDIEPAN